MAHSAQAKKRIRQNEVRRLRNKSAKSEIKTLTKRLEGLIESSGSDDGAKDAARELLPTLVSKLDKAGRRNVYHRNTVARKKSQIARLVNSLS